MHQNSSISLTRPRVILAALLCAGLAVTATAQSDLAGISARFVGVYELVEYAPHGDEPSGRIWYAANGQMSAVLFPPGRAATTNAMSDADFRAAMRGVVAYYGTYTIDVGAGTVTHHVMGGSNPAWIGTDFVRWFRFEGETLRLSLNPDFRGTLLWKRFPDE
jgi:hypothetical protein